MALLIFALVVIAFVVFEFGKSQVRSSQSHRVKIGDAVFTVDLADTIPSRIKGLSGRPILDEDAGMLFLFPVTMPQTFWMKDMKFPIDIIWIRDNRIVGMAIGAEPPAPGTADADLATYRSPEPVNEVLEINAGLSIKKGLKVGDEVVVESK